MNKSLLAVLLSASLATPAALAAPAAKASAEPGLRTTLHARYCDKLREGALEYVLFVRRLAPIHGYTYTDFAPAYPGAPVKADCRVDAARVAEVHALLRAAA
jgi:hypothetical protein